MCVTALLIQQKYIINDKYINFNYKFYKKYTLVYIKTTSQTQTYLIDHY